MSENDIHDIIKGCPRHSLLNSCEHAERIKEFSNYRKYLTPANYFNELSHEHWFFKFCPLRYPCSTDDHQRTSLKTLITSEQQPTGLKLRKKELAILAECIAESQPIPPNLLHSNTIEKDAKTKKRIDSLKSRLQNTNQSDNDN